MPKFILRQFLCDAEKERVAVYDKHENKTFVTAIKNIMAERRFHDFSIDDWTTSFEPIAGKIEQTVLPVYARVLETRMLDRTAESQAALAFLIAFQFLRTKASRELGASLEQGVRAKIEALGGRVEDLEGWEEVTEDVRKREHLRGVLDSIDEFARIIALKDFFLAAAGEGRTFYLGDHPVALHNRQNFGPYGNLGLALRGIEIYMPLSADLLLCGWCPSILADLASRRAEMQAACERDALAKVMAGRMTTAAMKVYLEDVKQQFANADELFSAVAAGTPIRSSLEEMDHYNSLQTSFAYRYVVAKDSNFAVAQQHNREFPKFRKGRQPTMS